MPDRETIPTFPGLHMDEGIIPILQQDGGEMSPGQFGPSSRDLLWEPRHVNMAHMSGWGMPSVITTISSISASTASIIAPATNGNIYIGKAIVI